MTASPYRGRLDAVGFVFGADVVGGDVLDRVREWWQDGARLLLLGDDLLLLLPEPVSVRSEHAPGLPLRRRAGVVEIPHEHGWRALDVDRLPAAALTAWAPGAAVELTPVPPPTVPEPEPAVPTPSGPSLRSRAEVRAAGKDVERDRRALVAAGERSRTRRSRTGATGSQRRGGRSLVARALLRTPVAGALGRRQLRYVQRLEQEFRRRNWDEALASAIGIAGVAAGLGAGALSLRMPGRRGPVTGPGVGRRVAGRTIPMGGTLQQHLAELYEQAARDLENEGQVLQAAYVLADLLGRPGTAAELLERHGQARVAAELAEGWELPVGHVVRLWWRAGERERAVAIAARQGAFGQALDLLGDSDPATSRGLREAWVHSAREAGDPLTAVRAAWPDPALRAAALPDIATGIALGGTTAGTLVGHLLEIDVGPALPLVLAALTDDAPADTRTAVLRTLADRRAPDGAVDREVASAALLTLVRVPDLLPSREHDTLRRSLERRADPLLVADLPPPARRTTPPERLAVELAPSGDGLPISDAVAIDERTILVALGEAGVRLLGHDGRVRGRWAVPAHRLVLADHGARVLLAADRQGVWTVHELDLPLGRPRLLPPLRAGHLLDGYDGRAVLEATPTHLRWLVPAGDRWRTDWSELVDEGAQLLDVARTPTSLAAVFRSRAGVQVWQWELPGPVLRRRGVVREQGVLLADGRRGVPDLDPTGRLQWLTPYDHAEVAVGVPDGVTGVVALGEGFAVSTSLGGLGEEIALHAVAHVSAAVFVTGPLGTRVRRWRDLVTVHAGDHVVVVDVVRRVVVAEARVRLGR